MKATCRIKKGSMGSYLLPPNHPGYHFEVEYDINRRPENRGGSALEYFAFEDNIDPRNEKIREQAKKLITDWNETKPLINSAEVKQWVEKVINHMEKPKGLKYIQKYYPFASEYVLTDSNKRYSFRTQMNRANTSIRKLRQSSSLKELDIALSDKVN